MVAQQNHDSNLSTTSSAAANGDKIIELQYKWGVGYIQVGYHISMNTIAYYFKIEKRYPDKDKGACENLPWKEKQLRIHCGDFRQA